MTDFKIKDIETLERLAPDEMERVVGGSVCPGNITIQPVRKRGKNDAAVLSAAIETIMEAVAEDDKVTLVGF